MAVWQALGPWVVLAAYCVVTWLATPRRVTSSQFFDGRSRSGSPPSVWLVAMSAAITWIFAKSIANAANLAYAFGPLGGIGYALYYLSFAVAGIAIYVLRTRGSYRSLAQFLVEKYGIFAGRLFLFTIAFRLFNEVWSNTKVMALYFGAEGSAGYWAAVILVTAFTVSYAWSGGMRASLLTDRVQTLWIVLLMGIVIAFLFPNLSAKGLPTVTTDVRRAGETFCFLALVQALSYPFHDPVLTDRGFLNAPKSMLKSFLIAGLLSGGFILLFSAIGLYGRSFGLSDDPVVSVPGAFGLLLLLVFNGIMLLSGGSTLDSTFTSTAKLAARDWRNDVGEAGLAQLRTGRFAVLVVAIAGNLPLLSIYLGDKAGPAIIAATTISGTMVMGLAPIFLLGWLRTAGALSFHLAFWPGVALGVARSIETFAKVAIFPSSLALGSGKYSLDLGLNVYGLLLCTVGFLLGVAVGERSRTRTRMQDAFRASV